MLRARRAGDAVIASKLTGTHFAAFMAGRNYDHRLRCMREARTARRAGFCESAKLWVGYAREANSQMLRWLREVRT